MYKVSVVYCIVVMTLGEVCALQITLKIQQDGDYSGGDCAKHVS